MQKQNMGFGAGPEPRLRREQKKAEDLDLDTNNALAARLSAVQVDETGEDMSQSMNSSMKMASTTSEKGGKFKKKLASEDAKILAMFQKKGENDININYENVQRNLQLRSDKTFVQEQKLKVYLEDMQSPSWAYRKNAYDDFLMSQNIKSVQWIIENRKQLLDDFIRVHLDHLNDCHFQVCVSATLSFCRIMETHTGDTKPYLEDILFHMIQNLAHSKDIVRQGGRVLYNKVNNLFTQEELVQAMLSVVWRAKPERHNHTLMTMIVFETVLQATQEFSKNFSNLSRTVQYSAKLLDDTNNVGYVESALRILGLCFAQRPMQCSKVFLEIDFEKQNTIRSLAEYYGFYDLASMINHIQTDHANYAAQNLEISRSDMGDSQAGADFMKGDNYILDMIWKSTVTDGIERLQNLQNLVSTCNDFDCSGKWKNYLDDIYIALQEGVNDKDSEVYSYSISMLQMLCEKQKDFVEENFKPLYMQCMSWSQTRPELQEYVNDLLTTVVNQSPDEGVELMLTELAKAKQEKLLFHLSCVNKILLAMNKNDIIDNMQDLVTSIQTLVKIENSEIRRSVIDTLVTVQQQTRKNIEFLLTEFSPQQIKMFQTFYKKKAPKEKENADKKEITQQGTSKKSRLH